jgi:hypothetical protein
MLHVVVRRSLARSVPDDAGPRLLLEGSWSTDDGVSPRHGDAALDDLIDARQSSIDLAAARLAEQIVAADDDRNGLGESFFHLNALRLRYAAVAWLRCLAGFRRLASSQSFDAATLYAAAAPTDDEYVAVWRAIGESQGFTLRVVRPAAVMPRPMPSVPPQRWRRWAARSLVCPAPCRRGDPATPRVLLCGNPRILGPVCDELLRRRAHVAWLFDRFAVRPWWRWGRRGVWMPTCDEPVVTEPTTIVAMPRGSIVADGIDWTEVADAWRRRWEPRFRSSQIRQRRRIEEHVASFRPTHIVVDEDATPLPRLVIAAGRDWGAASTVVQHGACGIRFGFAPLEADRIAVGDEGSRRQLLAWGVAGKRIVVTGSAHQDEFVAQIERAKPSSRRDGRRHILLLGTTPPRDDRPDAVTFRLTGRTYEAMLASAFAAVAELGDAVLIARHHPRTVDDSIFDAVRRRFPQVPLRMTEPRENLVDLLAAADCVLSCGSSAGIDAARAGRPVVQLLPAGSGPILPAAWYGLLGEARSLDELRPLLAHALSTPIPLCIHGVDPQATAARVVEAILSAAPSAASSLADSHDDWEAAHA